MSAQPRGAKPRTRNAETNNNKLIRGAESTRRPVTTMTILTWCLMIIFTGIAARITVRAKQYDARNKGKKHKAFRLT